MDYKVMVTAKGAQIVGLPDVYLHFAHHDFRIARTYGQEILHGVHTFYGGMGEGSSFDKWQDAIHTSLYDAFQVYDELKDGDTFTAQYLGDIAWFECQGVHVVPIPVVKRSKTEFEFVHQNMDTGELGKVMKMTQNAATRANNNLRDFGTRYRWVKKENVVASEPRT